MGTALHREIAQVAGDKPAFHVAHPILADLVVRRLLFALDHFVEPQPPAQPTFIQYPALTGKVQVGIVSSSARANISNLTVTVPDPTGGLFNITSASGFDVVFAVTGNGNRAQGLFTVLMHIQSVQITGKIDDQVLSLRDATLTFTTTVVPDPSGDANRIALGMTEREVARLEGLLEGSVAPKALKSIFEGAPPIPLALIFPAVVFEGPARLAIVQDGLLAIAENGWHLDEEQRCPCAAVAPNIGIKPQPGTVTDPDGIVPIKITVPPPRNPPWPVEKHVYGAVSMYLPRPTIRALTGGPYPAVAGYAEDNGFVGWTFDYTVAFLPGTNVSLTDPRATIVLTLNFYLAGSGAVTIDVPCIGRQDVGLVNAENHSGGTSFIEIGITPRLQPDGKIVLVPEILDLQVQPFVVHSYVIAAALLSYFGPWGSFAAFVIQVVVHEVIEHNLPIKVREATREAMGKQMWTLVDLSKVDVGRLFEDTQFIIEGVSREPDSMLVGIGVNPGLSTREA